MTNPGDMDPVPSELHGVERRLRDGRPELSALELDAVKRRAMASAARRSPSPFTTTKGILMKSRLAITLVLALGLLMSGTGATLAVSGLAGSGSAGTAQYPDVDQQPDEVLGVEEEEGVPPAPPTTEVAPVQETRQVTAADDATLPFTGFLAIPVLVGGVALLGAGIAMRRRVGSDEDDAEDASAS